MKKNSNVSLSNPIVAGAILLSILVFIALHPYMAYDEALWKYIGRIWTNNNLPPYVATVENKTPGIFMLFAFSEYISGGSIFFVRLIGAVAILVSSGIIYKIVKKTHSEFAAILAMYIFGLTSCWAVLDGFSLAQTETFMILFSVIAIYILVMAKGHQNFKVMMFLTGIALGLAISFKQIAVTTCLASLCLYLMYTTENISNAVKIKGLVLIALGLLMAILMLCLILIIYGVSILDYIDGAWIILFNSGSMAPSLETRIANFSRIFIFSRFIVFYPILIWALIKTKTYQNKFFTVLLLWLLFDFLGVNASGYYYGHQVKQILAPLGIISGVVLTTASKDGFFGRKIRVKKSLVLMVTIFIFLPIKHMVITGKKLYENKPDMNKELVQLINNNSSNDDYIYVYGADSSLILALANSNRISSSKYFSSIFISNEIERDIVYEDLKMKPPFFVLKEANMPISKTIYGNKITDLIELNYTIFRQINNVEILKRNY